MTNRQHVRGGSPAAVALATALVVGGVAGPLILGDPGTPPPAPSVVGDPRTPEPRAPSLVTADVAVYGATASGVIAAVSAARAGASVVLLEPTTHVGGMVSSGLGHTDVARKDLIGGLTLEFHVRVGSHYEMRRFGNFVSWYHEPHVADEVFREMLDEAGVRVLLGQRIDRAGGVVRGAGRIEEVRTLAGTTVRAATFIDSTYEGDLLAAAGAGYTVGRESRAEYEEPLAGVRPVEPARSGLEKVYGRFFATDEPLPGISADPLEPPGSADARVQSYTYRLCVTDVPANRAPFGEPEGYDRTRFALLGRAIETWTKLTGKPPARTSLMIITPLPNGKGDLNSAGLFSTDYVGGGDAWAEADDQTRDRLREEHRDHVAGVLYFLRTDEIVPQELRADVDRWGLCRDEFAEHGNWPPQLYVREARRMVGQAVLTQRDVQVDTAKPDSIGVGAYRIDTHVVRRVLDSNGFVRGEGHIDAPVEPYEIPLRILLPRPSEVENLVVSVAVSASHVAWASLRMEPHFMTMGEAAGIVAALAADGSLTVQDVRYDDVASILRARGGEVDAP